MAGQQPAAALGSNFVSHNHAFSQSNPFVTATSALPIAHSAQTLDQSQVKVTLPQAFYFMKSSAITVVLEVFKFCSWSSFTLFQVCANSVLKFAEVDNANSLHLPPHKTKVAVLSCAILL